MNSRTLRKLRVVEAVTEFARHFYPAEEMQRALQKMSGVKLAGAAKAEFFRVYREAQREDLPGSTPAPTPRKRLRERIRESAAVAAFRRRYSQD